MGFVREAHNQEATSSTTITATLSQAAASAAMICGSVVGGRNDAAVPVISTILDDKGNSYPVRQSNGDTQNATNMSSFSLENITNGPISVTVTYTAAMDFRSIVIHEVSGIATASAMDQHAGQSQDTPTITSPPTTPGGVSSGSVTTTVDGEYVYAAAANTAEAFGSLSSDTNGGYTNRVALNSTYTFIATEDQIQTSAGSISGLFHISAIRRVIAHVMTFKPASGSITSTPSVGSGTLTPVLAVPVIGTVKVPVTP